MSSYRSFRVASFVDQVSVLYGNGSFNENLLLRQSEAIPVGSGGLNSSSGGFFLVEQGNTAVTPRSGTYNTTGYIPTTLNVPCSNGVPSWSFRSSNQESCTRSVGNSLSADELISTHSQGCRKVPLGRVWSLSLFKPTFAS